MTGNKKSVFLSPYPVCNEKALVKDEVEVAVQVNSKMRARIVIPTGMDEAAIRELLLTDERTAPLFEGKEIKKLIVIPNRLVNAIV